MIKEGQSGNDERLEVRKLFKDISKPFRARSIVYLRVCTSDLVWRLLEGEPPQLVQVEDAMCA